MTAVVNTLAASFLPASFNYPPTEFYSTTFDTIIISFPPSVIYQAVYLLLRCRTSKQELFFFF